MYYLKKYIYKIYSMILWLCGTVVLRNKKSSNICWVDAWKYLKSKHQAKALAEQEIQKFCHDESDEILLSLIVPVYNEQLNIKKCLDALLGQKTNYRYEIIVVENASTDASPEILKTYESNEKIAAIYLQENRGGSVARNIGIAQAKGQYIGFIDCDDMVAINYVERLIETAMEYDADIVKCSYAINKAGKIIYRNNGDFCIHRENTDEKILSYDGYIWNAIYKRHIWENIRFPEEYWYEDIIMKSLIFRMSECFVYIPDVLYYYINPKSTSKMQNNSMSYKSAEQLYLVDYCISMGKLLKIKEDVSYYKLLLHELGDILYMRISSTEEEFQKNIFYVAAHIIQNYKKENNIDCFLALEDRMIEKAFLLDSFSGWKVAARCKYCVIRSK